MVHFGRCTCIVAPWVFKEHEVVADFVPAVSHFFDAADEDGAVCA